MIYFSDKGGGEGEARILETCETNLNKSSLINLKKKTYLYYERIPTKNDLNLPKIKPSFSQPLLALRPLIRCLESTGMPCFQGGRT